MPKSQQLLLTLLACIFSSPIFGQANISIEILGVSAEQTENIRLFLSIEQQKGHALLSEGRLRRLHNKAPQEIANALQPFGYYKPKIDSQLIHITPEQWQATYTIDPGPPLLIKLLDLVLSGELPDDPTFTALIDTLPLSEGAVFNHQQYENAKASLAKLAAERGYFNARFVEHRVEIDLDAYEARVHLHYDGSQRFSFGEILIQQDVLEPDLLQRFIPFERGSPFSQYQLIDLQQALNDSDYFSTVEVSPGQPQLDSNEIPISVILAPRKRHRYSMGLGYGTDTGARAKLGWDMPLFNSSGHRISSEAKVSEIGYSLSANYRVPVLNPRTDQMVYSAGVVNEKTDSSESTVRTIGTSLNRGRGAWRESLSINYQQEEYVIADVRGVSTLLIPGVNWTRTWGNDFIYTIDGLRFDINLRGASDKLVSDTSFFQIQGGLKAITSLGQRNRIIGRGRLGGTWTEEFNQLPSSVRFFAGGAQSVRGYAYQSLGPVNDAGQVVGGRHLMIGSIEFEHGLNGKWSIATFYDGGNAIDNIADKLERGAGVGLRWKSPVGSVRIDLASAVSRDGNPWRLHINIGPDL